MIKKLKILWLKWMWVLFKNKPYKEVQKEILKERGVVVLKPKTRIKISNGNYASTKRTNR